MVVVVEEYGVQEYRSMRETESDIILSLEMSKDFEKGKKGTVRRFSLLTSFFSIRYKFLENQIAQKEK